jgi:hypothetical protein
MLTLWCIGVTIGSLYFFGLPVTKLLSELQEDSEEIWIIAPFVGLAVIILTLQNLVYLNIRLGVSSPCLWVAMSVLWFWLLRSSRLKSLFSCVPRLLLVVALSVYLIHGLGLMLVGAKYYVGRAWHDQFNYTATTQFLVDYPFGLSVGDIDAQPYLFKGVRAKENRIGQSIFHGFIATSTSTDAKTTFESIILLSPFLISLAAYLLTGNLCQSKWSGLLASVGAGTLPGVTMVHLESFCSQALAIPLLLVWPYLVSQTIEDPTWRRLFLASLILAAGTSIYVEFYLLFLIVGALIFVVKMFRQWRTIPIVASYYVALVCTALLLDMGFIKVVKTVLQRVTVANVLSGIYPWAYSLEGLERVWFGDLVAGIPLPGAHTVPRLFLQSFDNIIAIPALQLPQLCGLIAFGLTSTAYLGLAIGAGKQKSGLALALLALAAAPLVVLVQGKEFGYQFYKLLLSISPLLVVGFVTLEAETEGIFCKITYFPILARIGVIILLIFTCLGTFDMVVRSGVGQTEAEIGRGGAQKLLAPATMKIQDILSQMRGQNVYIVWYDEFFAGNFINAWLAYFARHNRVWLSNTLLSDIDIRTVVKKMRPPRDPLSEAYLLTSCKLAPLLEGHAVESIWSLEPYCLWRFSSADKEIFEIINPKIRSSLKGFGSIDLVNTSETVGSDTNPDAVFKLRIRTLGTIQQIEVRNIGGMQSVWDTIPGNGAVLLGIADVDRPDVLLNASDGSVSISVDHSRTLLLYAADNSSVRDGKTRYQVEVTFVDGRSIRTIIRR